MAHTPGPWKVSYYAATREPAHRWTVGGYEWVEPYGATVCEMSGNPERAEANAHLIAAAPDLLAALRVLAARTETRIDYCFCETAKAIDGDLPCLFCLKQQARAAIEKAEGK